MNTIVMQYTGTNITYGFFQSYGPANIFESLNTLLNETPYKFRTAKFVYHEISSLDYDNFTKLINDDNADKLTKAIIKSILDVKNNGINSYIDFDDLVVQIRKVGGKLSVDYVYWDDKLSLT